MTKATDPTDNNSTPQLLLENQICFSLYSAANAMIRAYRPLLDTLNLTYPQYLVMLVLWRNNGINVKSLGNKLRLDSGTLTPLLKRLEAKGIIVRKRSNIDERSRDMYLTELGKNLKQKAAQVPETIFSKSGLKSEQLFALKSICDQLTQNLESKS
ncbi:MAG: DNA-binding MarR family transcriptional regulator [Colwellia sp.]|jgi:DNA-binding MarR family transcriptional regulator